MMPTTIRLLPAFAMLVAATATAESPNIPTSPSQILQTGSSSEEPGDNAGGDAAKAAAAVMEQQGGGEAKAQAETEKKGSDQRVKPVTLELEPGVTEVLPISKNHLNRIVTPYTEPEVRTTSNAKVEVDGHVVYVASRSSAPITLYIMSSASQAQALSLALVPRAVPPKEINLTLAEAESSGKARRLDPGAARAWEESQPYVQTIEQLLSGLARGKVPQGYGMDRITDAMWQPSCASPKGGDLTYDFAGIGQRVSGGSLLGYIGRVTNVDDEVIELDERWCRTEGVVATAFWPRIVLQPGEQAEVYVVRRREVRSSAPERPSLLGE